jgi:hypothetical protein
MLTLWPGMAVGTVAGALAGVLAVTDESGRGKYRVCVRSSIRAFRPDGR